LPSPAGPARPRGRHGTSGGRLRPREEVADGTRTKSEAAGIGEEEFAPWFIGPQL